MKTEYIGGGFKRQEINIEQKEEKAMGKLTDDVMMSCSRLASLMGYNKYSFPNNELKKSINALEPDYVRPVIENDAMWLGTQLEPTILKLAGIKLGIDVKISIPEPIKHKTLPLQGSLDGVATGKGDTIVTDHDKGIYIMDDNDIELEGLGVLEAKLTGVAPSNTPDLFRGPIQLQGLMMCLGVKWSALAILYQGVHHKVYVYKENKEIQDKISESVNDFQKRVDLYKRDSVTDWYAAVNPQDAAKTFSLDEGIESINLTKQDEDYAETILDANEAIKASTKLKNEASTALMNRLGNHSSGIGESLKIYWGNSPAKKAYSVDAREESRSKSIKVELINE